MAKITINIPDAALPRVMDGIAGRHGYRPTLPVPGQPNQTQPNPENKTQFVRRMIREYIRQSMIHHEGGQAAETARASKKAEVEAIDLDVS